MRRRNRALGQGNRATGQIAIAGVLFMLLLLGCGGPLPGSPGDSSTPMPGDLPHIETILPAGKEVIYVSPDGRQLLLHSTNGVVLLDALAKQELGIFPRLARVRWLDDELVYGERLTGPDPEHWVLNLQLRTAAKLQALPAASALSGALRNAASIYVLETEDGEPALLVLQHDAVGAVSGGYAVEDVHNLELLLSGVPHKVSPPTFLPNAAGEKYPSLDGRYYYLCQHWAGGLDVLEIYSQQDELLNSVMAPVSYPALTCHGWTMDGRGVYFQTVDPAGLARGARYGPFQVLVVEPWIWEHIPHCRR